MNNIYTIHHVMEKGAEYNKPLYELFTDYEKSFDLVRTLTLMDAPKVPRNRGDLPRLPDGIYKEGTGRITLHKQSDKFPIKKGLRLGGRIAPKLFRAGLGSLLLDWENLSVLINGEYLSYLRFTDETVLLSESAEQL